MILIIITLFKLSNTQKIELEIIKNRNITIYEDQKVNSIMMSK